MRLHLKQMKFFQFKRDSTRDLEAASSFALGSHPFCNITVTKKALVSIQQLLGL